MRLIEIPDDGIVRIPIMQGEATVGERRVDLSWMPTVDAVPVARGRWLRRGTHNNVFYECSECYVIGSPAWRCCPVCTARMDLEVNV